MLRLERLRRELSIQVENGVLTWQDLLRMRETVGRLVIKSLDDDEHPLVTQLQELKAWIDLNRVQSPVGPAVADRASSPVASPSKTAGTSNAHYFMPHPGISLSIQQFWPLQLLLHETACSSFFEALAVRLDIDADAVRQIVEKATALSVSYWSVLEFGSRLRAALALLDHPEPPLRLDGRKLMYGDQQVRLSPQQTVFVQLLLENTGKWIDHKRFASRGIRNPAKILQSLKKKTKAIVHLIHSKSGAYQLVESN